MTAFAIVDTKIENAEAYEHYKAIAKPLAESYGGVYRARGGAMEVLESDLWTPTRIVIVEFPSMEQARKFMVSDAYAPIKEMRRENAQCTVVLVEGAD
ncbi:MAG: DUF1330 domain-containing protein [Granulosicoccus sp.]